MTESNIVDFMVEDELSNFTLIVEDKRLYVHKEVLAVWSPVFKAMFLHSFKEKDARVVELPNKTVGDIIELLNCIYPPIHPITDGNVNQLLPLVEEYQVMAVKKKCEEFLLTKSGSMELLITAQTYGLQQLLQKCIECVRSKNILELQLDPCYQQIEPNNLIRVLQLKVFDLEVTIEQQRTSTSDRDRRLNNIINEVASHNDNFCTECKSREVNETCYNCLKMNRKKVKWACDEAKAYRTHNPLFKS